MALTDEKLKRMQARRSPPSNQQNQQDDQWQSEGALGDTAVGIAAGTAELPGIAAGIGDVAAAITTGADRPFSRAASALGEATGFEPGEWADDVRERYSPQMQESRQNVDKAWEQGEEAWEEGNYGGAVAGVASSYAKNPRQIQSLVTESLPSVVAGGALGRAAGAASGVRTAAQPVVRATKPTTLQAAQQSAASGQQVARGLASQQAKRQAATGTKQVNRLNPMQAGAVGEGAVMTGSTMSNIDPEVDAQRAALASLGVGILGAGIGLGGARVAQRMGVTDIDTALAGSTRDLTGRAAREGAERGAQRGFFSRVGGGAAAEGVLQELPQESMEAMATNWAEGNPLFEGVPRSAVEGMLAGGAMGAGTNLRRQRSPFEARNLTDRDPGTEPSRESADTASEQPTGPQTFDVVDREVGDLLRYHRRVSAVAREDSVDADLRDEAINRLDGVMRELDRRGVPREVVDESLARNRWTELQLQEETLQKKYADTLPTNPELARSYLQKTQATQQQKQALEAEYGRDTLLGPDYVITRSLRSDPTNEPLFRTKNGEVTNQLKPQSLKRLNEFRQQDDDSLLADVARDRADRESGAKVSKMAPLREAATAERGLGETEILQKSREQGFSVSPDAGTEADADPTATDAVAENATEGQPARPMTEEEAFMAQVEDDNYVDPPNVPPIPDPPADGVPVVQRGTQTESDPVTSGEPVTSLDAPSDPAQVSANVQAGQASDPASTSDPRFQALQQAANSSQATRDALWSVSEAMGQADAGQNMGTILQRASDLYAERRGGNVKAPRQSLDRSFGRLQKRLSKQLGDQAPQTLTAQSVITNFFGYSEPTGPDGDGGSLITESGDTLSRIGSAGGSQTSDASDARRETERYLGAELRAGRIDQAAYDESMQAYDEAERAAAPAEPQVESQQAPAQPQLSAEAQALIADTLATPEAESAGTMWDNLIDDGDPTWQDVVASAPDQAAAFVFELDAAREAEAEQAMAGIDGPSELELIEAGFADILGEVTNRASTPNVSTASTPAIPADVTGGEASVEASEPTTPPGDQQAATAETTPASEYRKQDGTAYKTGAAARSGLRAKRFQDLGLTAENTEVVQVEDGFVIRPMGSPVSEEISYDYTDAPNELLPDAVSAMQDIDDAIAMAEDNDAREDRKRLEGIRASLNRTITRLRKQNAAVDPPAKLVEQASKAIRKAQEETVPTLQGSRISRMQREIDEQTRTPEGVASRENARAALDASSRVRRMIAEGAMNGADLITIAQTLAEQVNNPYLRSILNALANHPRAANVRVVDVSAGTDGAIGIHESTADVIWIDLQGIESQASGILFGSQHDSASDPAAAFAEVVAHEMLHATTVQQLFSADPNSPDVVELREIQEAFRQWLVTQRDQLTEEQLDLLELVFDPTRDDGQTGANTGQLELITYGLTNPEVRALLQRAPDPNAPSRNLWQRVMAWFQQVLGLGDADAMVANSLFSRLNSYSGRVVTADHASVKNGWLSTEMLSVLWQQTRSQLDIVTSPRFANMEQAAPYREQAVAAYERAQDAYSDYMVAKLDGDKATQQQKGRETERALRDARFEINQIGALLGTQEGAGQSMRMLNRGSNIAQESNRDALARTYSFMAPKVVDHLKSFQGRVRKIGMLSMFSSDFVDYVKNWLPQARGYYDTIRWRVSERNKMQTELQDVVGPVANWDSAKRTKLNRFLAESTYQGKWGFQPEWLPTAAVDPAMKRQFDALPEDAQLVAKRMFEKAYEMHQTLQGELRADIERVFDASIERNSKPAKIQKLQRQKQAALDAHDKRQDGFRDAYLPLKRWGEWAVVYKSQAFRDTERNGTRKQIEDMKSDADHYMLSFADSQYQALQIRREWEAEGMEVDEPFPRMRYEENNELVPFDLIQRLKQDLANDDSGPNQAINSALDRVYIEALSESSVRKSELRRIGVRGFDEDMVRAFIQHGQGVANLTSSIRINWQTRQIVEEMKTSAKRTTANRPQAMAALNEVLARHAQTLEGPTQQWQQPIMAGTSIWMLLTSPAYYIQNATQPFMLTMPTLAARFGNNKTWSQMTRAYKEIGEIWSATRKGPHEGILIDLDQIADQGERGLFEELQGLGLLDVGIAADLGSITDARSKGVQLMGKAHHKMIHAVRTVEVFNRGVNAMAAYRLAYDKAIRDGRSEERAVRTAKDYATKSILETQGDYSTQNAPRLINKIPAGRILMQFRKFQLIQIGLLSRTVHQMFKGATPEEKAIGRRQMGYILGVHGVVGGLTGLPAAGLIAAAVGRAFDDEDEPKSWELRARRAIGDKDMADLVLNGLPAWAGLDASTRLGMATTFSVLPFTDIDASRDGFFVMAGSLLGPSVGLGAQFADGVGKMHNGDVLGGIAQLMPSIGKNTIKTLQYATEGVTTRTGVTAISAEEMDYFDLATQFLGWPSTTITDRYEIYGMLLDTQEHFRNRTTTIKKAYTEAYNSGNRKGMREAMDEWTRMQERKRAYGAGNPQPMSSLIKAPRERAEAEADMIGGVPTNNGNRRFVQELFE